MTETRADATIDRIARLLSAGTLSSVLVVAAASLLSLAAGRAPFETAAPPVELGRMVSDLLALRPEGFLWLGLLLILALPSARVTLALAGYARAGDRYATAVAASVLAVLALSVAVALTLG